MSSRRVIIHHRIVGAAVAAAAPIAPVRAALAQQPNDAEYTKLIKQFMRDRKTLHHHRPHRITFPRPRPSRRR